MLSRREFVTGAACAPFLRGATLTSKDRVDRAIQGKDVDRPPFTFWYHFLDETKPPESHAQSTLTFHKKFRTDLVKVMSDYAYPKPKGEWHALAVVENPYPQQIRALELIRDGLGGRAPFVETIFNPWNVAEKLSSKEKVKELKATNPQKLLDALEAIAKSEANHAKLAVRAGAAGVFLAIANAQAGVLSEADYAKFSEPFDKMILDAVKSAPLNVLHLHTDAEFGDKLFASRFHRGWAAAGINYTLHTGIAIAKLRADFGGVILAGLDERGYRKLTPAQLTTQKMLAVGAAGKKFILSPGCSVPNDSTDAELDLLPKLLGA